MALTSESSTFTQKDRQWNVFLKKITDMVIAAA